MLTEAQRKIRANGLGASDTAVVLGRDPHRTALDLWMQKVHPSDEDGATGDRIEAGNRFEPVVARWASEMLGVGIREMSPDTIWHPEHPWKFAHLDAVLDDGRPLEIKCLFDYERQKRLAELGEMEPLPEHFWQAQSQAATAGADEVVVAYLFGARVIPLVVRRDEDAIRIMLDAEQRFWTDNVLARVAPSSDNAESTARALRALHPRDSGVLRTESGDVVAACQRLATIKAEVKRIDTEKTAAENAVRALIGDDLGFAGEWGRVTARTQERQTIDTKALKAAHPEIAKQFLRTSTARPLRVKLAGGEEIE